MAEAPQSDAAPEFFAPGGDAAAGDPPKAVLLSRDNCDQPAKRRKQTYHGKVDFWNQYKCYGYAYFEGFSDRVLFHAKDCAGDMQPSAGDAATAIIHRRRKDGKLQAFSVKQAKTMEERLDRVHNTLLGSS